VAAKQKNRPGMAADAAIVPVEGCDAAEGKDGEQRPATSNLMGGAGGARGNGDAHFLLWLEQQRTMATKSMSRKT
jgi:hypothetical protein